MKAKQAMLVVCDDTANLQKIAAGIRGIPGVTETRTGTFSREHVTHHQVDLFIPAAAKGVPGQRVIVEDQPAK